MKSTNVFEILGLSRAEDPHDRMLAWLCDPTGGHGISDFAAKLIHKLWVYRIDEEVSVVKRQYPLGADSWPDVVVEFESSLLVVENKVNASALREGQLELQNALDRVKQGNQPFFHVLLCPDRFRVDGFGPKSEDFRALKYSQLGKLVRAASETAADTYIGVILRAYATFIEKAFGHEAISGLRIATAQSIARRNNDRLAWSEELFLEQVQRESPSLAKFQIELIELLQSLECVEPRFDSIGPTNATYKVYLSGTENHPLWVYSDGRLYARWAPLELLAGLATVAAYKRIWGSLVNSINKDGSYIAGGLARNSPIEIASKLQELSDIVTKTKTADDKH